MDNTEANLAKRVEAELKKPCSNSILFNVRSADGRVLDEGAAGEGTPNSPYFLASFSKMYKATVIMQLVDDGLRDLNDPIDINHSHHPLDGIHFYKGSGYQLLGPLIEVIAGQPLADVLTERAFVPAEMTDTYLFNYNRPTASVFLARALECLCQWR